MLSGLCEACNQEEQQTTTDDGDEAQTVVDDNDDDAESDHGEADLELLMAGANELQTDYTGQMQEALDAERQTQEQEAFQRMVDEETAAHLAEQRQRMREGLEAARILPLYRQEEPVYFDPSFWAHDPSEIQEATGRRIAHEVRERHIHSGSDGALISGESSSNDVWYRPDLSGPPGRLRRGERMDRYFHSTPAEPYDEPMAWKLQGCASTAEEEMLEQGYGEGVVNNGWHRYWANANGEAEIISTAAASSRLEHLGEVESRNQDWYYGYHNPDDIQ